MLTKERESGLVSGFTYKMKKLIVDLGRVILKLSMGHFQRKIRRCQYTVLKISHVF